MGRVGSFEPLERRQRKEEVPHPAALKTEPEKKREEKKGRKESTRLLP